MRYLRSFEICDELKISPATLKKWKDEGKIIFKKLSDRKYLYDIDSILERDETKEIAIYGRVSTTSQKEELNKQIELLKTYCFANGIKPKYIISDIASGLDENRKGLNELFNLVFDKKYLRYSLHIKTV